MFEGVDVVDNQVADLLIVCFAAFVEVIAQQFVQGFGVWFVGRDHFRLIAGLFGFDNDPDRVLGSAAIVDHQVLAVFGIDEVFFAVEGRFQEVGNDVFEVFFTFRSGMAEVFEQAAQFGFEGFQPGAIHILDAVGRVEGFRDCLREEPHGGGDGLGRKYRVNWAIA